MHYKIRRTLFKSKANTKRSKNKIIKNREAEVGKEVCRIIHHRGSQQILFKVDQTRTRSSVPEVTIVAREETVTSGCLWG